MGKRWDGMIIAWTYALHQVFEAMPEYSSARDEYGNFQANYVKDHMIECLMGQALHLVRLVAFMEKMGMIIEIQKEQVEPNHDGCDQMMHHHDDNNDSIDALIKDQSLDSSDLDEKAVQKFSYYGKIKLNLNAVQFENQGDAEKMASSGVEVASGNAEEAPRDHQYTRLQAAGLHGDYSSSLRGGMEQEDDWKVVQRKKRGASKSFYKGVVWNIKALEARSGALGVEDSQDGAFQEDESAAWDISEVDSRDSPSHGGESSQDEELRGGAGGAATTNRKRQVAEAIGQMESILSGLQTQPDDKHADETEEVLGEFKRLVKTWEDKKPSKDEMKKQVEGLLKKLKAMSEPVVEPPKKSERQSFYDEFHKKAQEKAEEKAAAKGSKGRSKGKGKGKSKSKDEGGLPKFDLRQAFPQMNVNSWLAVMADLEEGREPRGTVAVCPSLQMSKGGRNPSFVSCT